MAKKTSCIKNVSNEHVSSNFILRIFQFQNFHDQALSTLSVSEVCNLLGNIKGINPIQINAYKSRIVDNNIGGLVLSACDLEELREVLAMKFGDWQLFKSVLIGLRKREEEKEEKSQFESGLNQNEDEADAMFDSISNHTNPFGSFSDGKFDRADRNSGQEPFTKPGMSNLQARRMRMTRVDSAYGQAAFETGLLREAMNNFTEEEEEDEDSIRPNVSFAIDTKGGSLEDVDDGINSTESQPLLTARSQKFSDSRRKESLSVLHEAEETESPTAMFYLDETENASPRGSKREDGNQGSIPMVTFHTGENSREEHV